MGKHEKNSTSRILESGKLTNEFRIRQDPRLRVTSVNAKEGRAAMQRLSRNRQILLTSVFQVCLSLGIAAPAHMAHATR